MDPKYKGFNDAYKIYLKNNSDKEGAILDKKLAKRLFEAIMVKVWEKMIKDRAIYRAPYGMGKFMIIEKPSSTNGMTWYIDWQESRRQGKHVKKPNLDSGGYKHGCYWDKTLCKIKNVAAYRFVFARGCSDCGYGFRYLGRYIKDYNSNSDSGIYRSNIKH